MRSFIIVSGLLLVVSLMSGCGERIESTSYYYSPTWTRGGSIVFIYGLQTGSTYTETVKSMNTAGESGSVSFDVTGAPPYYMSCSPAADYVAYLDGLNSGLFSKIVIRNISATSPHTGLEKTELSFSPGIKSFDWSSDGTRFVYCTTREVHTILITGTGDTLVTPESNLSFVAWKYGNRIAYVHSSEADTILSLIYPDTTGQINLAVAASVDIPSISSLNTNEVYGIAGGSYCKVDVSAGTPATTEVLASFTGVVPRLSADAATVVYKKTGESSGIYTLTIATPTQTKIK